MKPRTRLIYHLRALQKREISYSVRRRADASDFAKQAPVQKPRRRVLRTTLIWSSLLLAAGYGIGAYLSTSNERIRHFYAENFPLGRSIIETIEDRELKSLGAGPGQARSAAVDDSIRQARQKAQDAARLAAQKKRELEAKAAPVVNKVDQAVASAKAESGKIDQKVTQAASTAKAKVESAAGKATNLVQSKVADAQKAVEPQAKSVQATVREAKDEATTTLSKAAQAVKTTVVQAADSTHDLISQAETALGLSARSSVVEAAQVANKGRQRELDPTPQPTKAPEGQPYLGPPLPLGFEPPPGFYLPKKAASKAAQPEPLPLLAPAVSKLSADEPMLGQLAATIDSLAAYVKESPAKAGDKLKQALNTAENDLKGLGSRLNEIKASEHTKLESRLAEQQKQYSEQLQTKERELFQQLQAQESDWQSAFEQERKQLIETYRAKLDAELAAQKDIINQRLQEEVVAQGITMQRKWLADIKAKVEEERGGRLARLDELHDGLKKLGQVTLDNDNYLSESLKVNRLWSAVQAAQSAVGKPLTNEFRALKELAGDQPTVIAALASVSNDTLAKGVEPLSYLSAWFSNSVSGSIKRAAMMPDRGGFLSYLTSAALSPLLFSRTGPAIGDDVMSILSRAHHYLDSKDVDGAAREINQLKGWPKILAKDWLEACRRYCEVKQALKIAENEAKIKSFLVI